MGKYKLQDTSLWRFPERGDWATHKGDYRGNWSPHIPRNLILKYSNPNDTILDVFVGSGTTLIECKLLNRNGIGIDINQNALDISKKRLELNVSNNSKTILYKGNAAKLSMITHNSIDFICTHPPYSDIIKYSNNISGDLSHLSYNDFLDAIEPVASECYRVLKDNKFCAFMIGDIRKNGFIIPLGFLTMQKFVKAGFTLKEIIIKEQFNCKSTNYWKEKSKQMNFYLLAHEYIFIFKK